VHFNDKQGFTLLELAVVVAIVGVLSALGVSGLQKAVMNDRARSAADELAAIFNQAASIAKQRSDSLCFMPPVSANNLVLRVYNTEDGVCDGDTIRVFPLDGLTVETPPRLDKLKSLLEIDAEYGPARDWANSASGNEALFVPRIGLNPIATQGFIGVKVNESRHAAVGKGAFSNYFQAYVCYNCDDDWGGPWWISHR